MSAIAGIMSLDGAPLAPCLIGGLTKAMALRGPDGIRHWSNGSVALGLCILQNTPESLADRQLQVSGSENLVLVFDGRLDNRLELIKIFSQHGISLNGRSDTDFVLAAYRLWSNDCPAYLLGDFSFVVFDIDQQKLFCARDQVGARSFYYAVNKKFFAFASDDEALLKLPGVSNKPDDDLIAHFLLSDFEDFHPDQALLKDVRILLPAHSMVISPYGVQEPTSYWQFKLNDENNYANDRECQEAFLEVFGYAMQSRLRLLGDPAAIISGGMDSGGISAMMTRMAPGLPGGRYHTYSALGDDPAVSLESRSIRSMTQHDHVHAHSVNVPSFTGMVSSDDLIKMAWEKAHPVDNSILLVKSMCLAASRNGHQVLLHGVSGDLAMGYSLGYIAPLLRSHQWLSGWQECKAAAQNHTFAGGAQPLQILLRNALTAFLPLPVKKQLRRARRRLNKARLDIGILNPDFVKKLDLMSRLDSQHTRLTNIAEGGIRHQRVASVFGVKGVAIGLSGYQRVASRSGVEMRDPWGDKRVLDFFLHLPLHQLVRNGWTKYLARSTFSQELGESVVWRSDKEHLGWLYIDRLMNECDEFVEHSLNDELTVIEDYVDIHKVRSIYLQYKSSGDWTKKLDIYHFTTLIHWLKRLSNQSVS